MQTDVAAPIHGPRGIAKWRVAARFGRDPLGTLLHLSHTYGDLVRFRLGAFNAVLVSHPDDVREILVTHNQLFSRRRSARQQRRPLLGNGLLNTTGEVHLRQRRLLQPAFHRQRIGAYGTTMVDYATRISESWEDGTTVDMAAEMMRLGLGIVGKTLFDVDVEGEATTIRDALTTVVRLAGRRRFSLAAGLLRFLPLPGPRGMPEARARLDGIVYRIIEERRQSHEDRGDVLSMLLLARDSEGDGLGMSDEQVRDEVMTLIGAGFETTATWLTWTFLLLAQHPEIEQRVHDELASVLRGAEPTAADVARLPYLKMVLSESLRLYPPVWMTGRQPLKEYSIHGNTVQPGQTILVSQYVVHRDPRWYPDPDRFDPERWTDQAKATRPQFSFFAFGGGPHLCIGEPFGWMEATLVIASIAQRWRASLVPGQVVVAEPLITLQPRNGLPMTLRRR